ncbi:MAG: polysaccharide biosynthesis C-terminal domain-containing protein, partial [Lachnospiraceae bacterium]|nr:polysaccharide biosynthesis C-terminal domain-containing protein [Lachnospiraceae bacterium]
IPFIIVQIYASTLRETGKTFVPMVAGVIAVFVNLIFNYILIFGKFGAPQLGVSGAALATALSRVVEFLIVVIWTHKNKEINRFIIGAYRTLKIPASLAGDIIRKGTPLLFNEVLWAAGVAVVNQCFSVRGLTVVAGMNIASTIANLFNVIFIALGSAVAIMVGQELGANDFDKAKDTAGKVIAFSVCCTIVTSILMILMGGLFPKLYNTTEEIRQLATSMIRITACVMPLQAFLHATYFTIRSGGKTIITFFFDSGYSWCVGIPFAYLIIHYTGLPILTIYLLYYLLDIIKATVGYILLKKGVWLNNIVA